MSTVPERTLNWLYSVLTSEYHDVQRTYSDVATILSQYTSLKPRTEVYTYENGTSALLLLVSGTLPVNFRGQTYRFPIAIWVPHAYPYEAPLVYVTPAPGMALVPGNHVGGEGRVYHRYLAQWGQYWDRSSILDFLDILRSVFAKEAPVRAQQQDGPAGAGGQQQNMQQPVPPPVPPPPEEWRGAQQEPAAVQTPRPDSRPPPVPPKPGENLDGYSPTATGRDAREGPPPPPLPPGAASHTHSQPQWQHPQNGSPVPQQQYAPMPPQRQASLSRSDQMPPHMRQHMMPQQAYRSSQYGNEGSPVSPARPEFPQSPGYQQQGVPQPRSTFQYEPSPPPVQNHQQQYAHGAPPQQYGQQLPYGQQAPPPLQQYQQHLANVQAPVHPHPQPQPQPALDLLTSPLDVTLPSQDPSNNQQQLPVPPVPPNPQKDAILTALAQSLHQQLTSTLASNASAAASLRSQNQSLQTAFARLQSELRDIDVLGKEVDSNERILHETMREADRVMADAHARRRPEIDEVLVAPTVVGNQLYREAAEIEALVEARALLARALDGGAVGVTEWGRVVRSLAREEFGKRALVRKIARGMGLEEVDKGGGVGAQGGNDGWAEDAFYGGHGR